MTVPHQPDPRRGVFETLLVVDGEPVELEAHLRRLAQSLGEVYSQELPPHLEDQLRQAAEGSSLGRVRATVAPAEDGLRIDLLAGWVDAETVFPSRGVKLRTHPVACGLGAHKWVDRKGINRPAPDEAGALVVDDGEVLEAGWANVFAVRDGGLFTPPLDNRILPGIARAALLELAPDRGLAVSEEPLRRTDLLAADETFLTNSVRGVEAALSLDGARLQGAGPVSRRLAAGLRERWRLPAHRDALPAPAAAPLPGPPAR